MAACCPGPQVGKTGGAAAMPKKPAYATEGDLADAKAELEAGTERAKEAGEKAAKDVRAELVSELGKLSKTVSSNAETTKEAMKRVAKDSKAYSEMCANNVKEELLPLFPPIDDRIKAAQQNVEAQLQTVDSELKNLFADELMALTTQFDKELSSVRAELMAGSEQWAREAAEALVAQRRELDAAIEKVRKEAAAKLEEVKGAAEKRSEAIVVKQSKVDELQNERNERAQGEIWLKLDRLDDLLKEARAAAKEHTEDVDIATKAAISDLRTDAEKRFADLDEQTEKLHDAVSEVENIPTRRVDWVIKDVSRRLRPPTPSKACLHTSWFSPKFDMAGAHGLQLELQLFRASDPPVEGEAAGDCAAYLWACKGMNLVYKLYIGTKSAQLERVFNGRVPYGTKRLCFLKDQINREEDSLRVSIEILEAVREVEHVIKAPALPAGGEVDGEIDERSKPLEGKVVFRRHLNNRLLEQVKSQVESMKSRMVRRVEWRLEQASMLRRCFPPGESICSVAFAAAGVDNLQLLFYPCGYGGATDGFCSFFLYAPAGATLKYTLYAGSQRRDATHFFEDPGAFGRTNFCRFESIVEEDTDTILLALEIDEAHQDVVSKVAHPVVQAGDRRTQGQIDAAVPAAVESVVKLHKAPGKASTASLEDKRVLPSLWTAKLLGDRKGALDDVHSFEELREPARKLHSSGGKRTQPSSPEGSMTLVASKSSPLLGKELGEAIPLPQLGRTGGTEWGAYDPIGLKKGRNSVRSRMGLAPLQGLHSAAQVVN